MNRKQVTNLSLFIMGGMLIASIAFMVRTTYDIKSVSTTIHRQRTELERKYQTGQSLKELIRILQDMQPRIESLNQTLLPSDDTLSFINDLEVIAEKHHLKQVIKLADFEPIENQIISTPIQVSVDGTYNNFLNYIAELDRQPFYFNIITMTINSQLSAGSNEQIQASIDANIYWR